MSGYSHLSAGEGGVGRVATQALALRAVSFAIKSFLGALLRALTAKTICFSR